MWYAVYSLRQLLALYYGYDIGVAPSVRPRNSDSTSLLPDDRDGNRFDREAMDHRTSYPRSNKVNIQKILPGVGVFDDAPAATSPTETPAGSYSSGEYSMQDFTRGGPAG